MKRLRLLLSCIIVVIFIIGMVSAAIAADSKPVVNICQESAGMAEVYKLVVNLTLPASEGVVRAFYISISFDNTVIIPVERTTGTPITSPLSNQRTPFNTDLVNGIVPNQNLWAVGDTRTSFEVSAYDSDGMSAATGITALEFYFALRNGKTSDDMNSETFTLIEGMDGKIYVGSSKAVMDYYYGKTGKEASIEMNSFTYMNSGNKVAVDKNLSGSDSSPNQHNDTNINNSVAGDNKSTSDRTDTTNGLTNDKSNFHFIDVRENDWFYNAVKYVFEHSLMIGVTDDKFDCDASLTRAMIVTILYRHAGNPDVSSLANHFEDVSEKLWYTDAVKWASSNGIVVGYGNGRFGTHDAVTNEQLAVLIHRTQQSSGQIPPVIQVSKNYSDFVSVQ